LMIVVIAAMASLPQKYSVMNEQTNMTGKNRNMFETAIYSLLMLGPLIAIMPT
jgi:hypothetical protein